MDGGDTPQPSIQATFLAFSFALRRLGVSGLWKGREEGFRDLGGGYGAIGFKSFLAKTIAILFF